MFSWLAASMASPPDFALVTRLLPLAIGAAVSPMVLVFQLLNLSGSRQALARSGAFLLGCTLVVILWLLCAGWIAALLPPANAGPDPIAAAFDAVFALLLVALGVRILTQTPPATPQPARHGLWTPALGGLVLMACNITSLVLFLPAIQDITRAGLQGPAWWLAALALAVITLVPAWLPPALVLLLGARGHQLLQRLSAWVMPRQRVINAGVTLLLAVVLGWRAILKA